MRDIVDTVTNLQRRVRAMETRAMPYYDDPVSGVTDLEATPLTILAGWGCYTGYGPAARVVADVVTMLGACYPTAVPPTGSVCVLPERLRPQAPVRARTRATSVLTPGDPPTATFTVGEDGRLSAHSDDWHGTLGWFSLSMLSWPYPQDRDVAP
jgi:hypothetical protein